MLSKDFANKFIELVNKYENINVFCHINPDYDTLGSGYGLVEFLKINYPTKNIQVVNTNKIKNIKNSQLLHFATTDTNIKDINNSLGIVVDVHSKERILGSEFLDNCEKLIIIDHHILDCQIDCLNWIDENYPACCEMIAELIKFLHENNGMKINQKCLTYLYAGLLTDTNRFLYQGVQSNTYRIVGWLADNNIDKNLVHNELYLRNLKDAKRRAKFLNLVKINQFGVGSLLLTKKYNKKYKMLGFHDAISIMEGFNEIKIWTSCYFNEETKTWNCSLRSRDYPVVEIANKYNGGGHKLAAGCRIKSPKIFKNIINDLSKLIENYDNTKNI